MADDFDPPIFQTLTSFRGPGLKDLPGELAKAVLSSLLNAGSTRSGRTRAIKEGLEQWCQRRSLHCHVSGQRGRKEWLYDLVASSQPDDRGHFHDVVVIGEIELQRAISAIERDFRKLLIGRAPIKLLVYELGDPEHFRTMYEADDLIDRWTNMVADFRNSEVAEIYLFVDAGQHQTKVWEVSREHLHDPY